MQLKQLFRIPRTLTVYVDKERTDIYTPDGSMSRPYKTFKEGYESITDAGSTKRYAVVVRNGFYTEDNPITIKPYVYVQGDFKHNPRLIPNDNNQPMFTFPDGYSTMDFGEITFIAPTNNAVFSATGANARPICGIYYCLFIAPSGAGANCEAFHCESYPGGFHVVNSMCYSEYWTGAKFGCFANMIAGNYRDTGMHVHENTIMDYYLKQLGEGHIEIDLLLTDTDEIDTMYYIDNTDAKFMLSNQVSSNPGDCSSKGIHVEEGNVRIRNSDLWGECYFGEDSDSSIQTSEFLNFSWVEGYKPTELIITQCKSIKTNGVIPPTCESYCAYVHGDNTRIHFTGNSFVSPAGVEPVQLDGTFISIEAQGVSQYDVNQLASGASATFDHLPDLSYARVVQISRYTSDDYDSLDFDTTDESDYYQENDSKTKFIDDKVKLEYSEPSGTFVRDSSGNDRNGITINMEDADWVAGKLNNGLQFDGVNEYVNLGDIANFERTDTFSLECWAKWNSTTSDALISRCETGSDGKGWIFFAYDGYIWMALRKNGSYYIMVRTNLKWNNNVLHHIIMTYDGSGIASGVTIYVDNVNQAITTVQDNLDGTIINSTDCHIGNRAVGDYFTGLIDEAVIYDRELGGTEVSDRWNGGVGTETLFGTAYGHYHLNGGTYDTTKGWYIRTDTNQIDTSNWHNIGRIEITQTTPANTDIRYLVSIEGHGSGVNWKKWDGASWITVSLANIDTLGHTKTEIEALTDSEWGDLFVGVSSSTLDIIVSLKTTNPSVSPELDQIDIIYLLSARHLAYDNDFKVEFLDSTHTKITNTISPPELLYGIKANVFMLTPF